MTIRRISSTPRRSAGTYFNKLLEESRRSALCPDRNPVQQQTQHNGSALRYNLYYVFSGPGVRCRKERDCGFVKRRGIIPDVVGSTGQARLRRSGCHSWKSIAAIGAARGPLSVQRQCRLAPAALRRYWRCNMIGLPGGQGRIGVRVLCISGDTFGNTFSLISMNPVQPVRESAIA